MRIASLLLLACLAVAVESVGAAVDARIQKFEQAVDAAFKPVQNQLEAWRIKRAKTALAEVAGLLPKAGPGDRVFLAYQLLAADPKHKAAREVYTALGLPPPFAEDGTPVASTRAPACNDIATVTKAVDLRFPPFDEVTKAVDLRGSAAAPFWKKLEAELLALRKDLARIALERAAEGAANTVYPLLAFYQPKAPEVEAYYAATGKPAPVGRAWFNPVDRWLLDRELAGVDAMRQVGRMPPAWQLGGGQLPATVPGAGCEVIATWKPGARIVFSGPHGNAMIAWSWMGGKLRMHPGERAQAIDVPLDIDIDLGTVAVPVRCEVRGRKALVAIGGIPVASCELPQTVAIRSWSVAALEPRLLRIRYLAAAPELDLLGDGAVAAKAPAKPADAAKPAPPAWIDERTKLLLKPVTLAFADQRLDEVAAALSSITGTPFRLAASAESLADLPVTMTAKDVPLRTALEWLRRLAELEAVPEEQGFRLEWKR